MTANSFSAMLRELVDDVQLDLISFEEYRLRRRILLNQIDEEYNGVPPQEHSENKSGQVHGEEQSPQFDGDLTNPDLMQTIVYSPYDKQHED